MTRLGIVLALFLTSPLAAAPRRRAVSQPQFPPCRIVTGTSAVTFTRDQGQTLAPTAEPLRGIAYTYGLAALDTPGTLMAWHKDDLLISTDDGCAWRVAATIPGADFPPRLTPARGGRVYAWSDGRRFLVRWDSRGAVTLKAPTEFVGLESHASDPDLVRGGGSDGSIWESRDAGETWTAVGQVPATSVYRVAFDRTNLDHIVAGALASGVHATSDGRTWFRAGGLPSSANITNVVISPVDSNVVWAYGIDLGDSTRHIYLSWNGGFTFERAVSGSGEVTLTNQPIMAAHPTDRNVLYFVFGTYFQAYGTDIFRFDAATRALTKTHNDHHDINAIAFSTIAPHVMYLGLEREER